VNSTHAASDFKEFPALRQSFRRGDRAKSLVEAGRRAELLENAKAARIAPWTHPEGTPFAPLEQATATFRYLQQRKYRAKAHEARTRAGGLAAAWAFALSVPDFPLDLEAARTEEADALASAHWYEGRAGAQVPRFDTVRGCGTRKLHVTCRPCKTELCAPIPCRCGVVRVCAACADEIALKREKRIADGRSAAILVADELGLFKAGRDGLGAWSEKMLTLTVPHVELADVAPLSHVAKACEGFGLATTIAARIAALRLAWPRFMRTLRRFIAKHEGKTRAKAFRYFRFLEWTRGSDGQGHPHFHVYLLSPFLNQQMLVSMWTRALEAVGVGDALMSSCRRCVENPEAPCAARPHAVVEIKRLYGYKPQQLRELIKRGDRKAIECRLGPLVGPDAVTNYANGWTMADAFDDLADEQTIEAKRDVYVALEGRRMAQGARGFLLPKRRPACAWCGCGCFAAHVADPCKKEEKAIARRRPLRRETATDMELATYSDGDDQEAGPVALCSHCAEQHRANPCASAIEPIPVVVHAGHCHECHAGWCECRGSLPCNYCPRRNSHVILTAPLVLYRIVAPRAPSTIPRPLKG
jgi:hypothetical protein